MSEYVNRAKAAGLTWPLPEALDEDQPYRLLFPKPAPPSDRVIPIPDWNYTTWTYAATASLCRRLGSSPGTPTPQGRVGCSRVGPP